MRAYSTKNRRAASGRMRRDSREWRPNVNSPFARSAPKILRPRTSKSNSPRHYVADEENVAAVVIAVDPPGSEGVETRQWPLSKEAVVPGSEVRELVTRVELSK